MYWTKESLLYGLADEIIKLPPIPVSYIGQALNVNTIAAVEEYSIWVAFLVTGSYVQIIQIWTLPYGNWL